MSEIGYPHVSNQARKVKNVHFDTIAAISTPMGEGAIAIVRLSGDEAVQIADRIFRSPSGKRLNEEQSHTIHYGHLIDPSTDETVEEVMVSLMKAPKTFTREDVVEVNCHGGIVAVTRVLQLSAESKGHVLQNPVNLQNVHSLMDELICLKPKRSWTLFVQRQTVP